MGRRLILSKVRSGQSSRLAAFALVLVTLCGLAIGVAPAEASSPAISGHVYLGTTATPAGPADVTVSFQADFYGAQVQSGEAHPDAEGYYSFDVPPGTYRLYFHYDGTGTYSSMSWNNRPEGGSDVLTVTPSVPLVADITLPSPAAITGTVSLGVAGVPPPAGDVSIRYRLYDLDLDAYGPEIEGALSGAGGSYTIPNLKAGYYYIGFIYVGPGGYQDRWWSDSPIWQYATKLGFTAGSDRNAVDMVLPTTATISGTVTLGSPPVPAGAGAATVTVEKQDFVSSQWHPIATSATTDATGRYDLPGLSHGAYRLTFSPPAGYLAATSGPVYVLSSPVEQNVNLAVARSVSGHVDVDGKPATNGQIRVNLVPYLYGLATQTGLTDANGNFVFDAVASASYTLQFVSGSGDYYPPWGWNTSGGGYAESFSVTSNRTGMNVNIPANRSLAGRVTNVAGDPVEGVEVDVSGYYKTSGSYQGRHVATTAADGTYDFFGLNNDLFYVVDYYDPQQRYSEQTWGGLSMYYYPWTFDTPSFGVDATMYLRSSISTTVSSEHPEELGLGGNYVNYYLQVFDTTTHEYVTVLGPTPVEDPAGNWNLPNLFPDNYRLYLDYTGPNGFKDVLTPSIVIDENEHEELNFWLGRGASQYTTFFDVLPNHPFTTEIEWMFDEGISSGYIEPTGQRSYRPTTAVTRQAMAAFLYRAEGSPAFVPPTTPTFSDVPISHPFYKEIEWMKSEGISSGYVSGDTFEFRPNASVTRQAMAAFLYRAAGSPDFVPPPLQSFNDVPTDHPFYTEIEWMADAGISTGYPATWSSDFRLNTAVSRQAMAAFLFRFDNQAAPVSAKLLARGELPIEGQTVIGPVDREDLVLTVP